MKTKNFMVKTMFMSIITAAFTTIVLTSCSDDDIITDNINPAVATTNNDSISIQQVINDLTRGTHVDLTNETLNKEQCLKFYHALDEKLGEIHKKYSKNANVMTPWMTKYVLEHKEDKMGIVTCDFAGFDG